jgi:hypothetical protein
MSERSCGERRNGENRSVVYIAAACIGGNFGTSALRWAGVSWPLSHVELHWHEVLFSEMYFLYN